MKVLVVMNGAPDAAERDVHSRRLPALFTALKGLGVQVNLALLGDAAGLADDFVGAVHDVKVLGVALPPTLTGFARVPQVVGPLRRHIRHVEPDLVEGDEALPALAAAAAMRDRSLPGSPTLLYRRHHLSGRLRLRVASAAAAHAAHAVVVSTDALRKQAARDDHVPTSRVLVTRSGAQRLRDVAEEETRALRIALDIPPTAVVVGVVSRLRWEKGIDVLIDAIDLLENLPVHVVVAGRGPEESGLRAAAQRARRPVHLVGHHADVAPWLALADVIAIPSRRESFGRTTIEAMAAGRPIVASRVGGLVEAVEDGTTGILIDADDPTALAKALSRLVDDREGMRQMGFHAKQRFESRHTIDHMAQSWAAGWRLALTHTASGANAG